MTDAKTPFVNDVVYSRREFRMWVLSPNPNDPPDSMAVATIFEYEPLQTVEGKEPPDEAVKFYSAFVTLMVPTPQGLRPLESEVPVKDATTVAEAFKNYHATCEGFAREVEEHARKPKLMLPPGVGAPNNPFGRRK